MRRGIGRLRVGGGGALPDVSTFFANGEDGFILDPSSLANLKQDSAGTTAVTASGDPVGRIVDNSPNGFNMLQATGANRPVYNVASGLKSVAFNGSSQWMTSTNVDFAGSTKITVVAGIKPASTGLGVLWAHGDPAGASGGIRSIINWTLAGSFGGGVGSSPSNFAHNNAPKEVISSSVAYVASMVFDPAGATNKEQVRIRINGLEVDESIVGNGGTPTTGAFALRDFILGALTAAGSSPALFNLYGMIAVDRELTTLELRAAEAWCASRSGVSVPASSSLTELTPSLWWDTTATSAQTYYTYTSPFAKTVFTTTASTLYVECFNNNLYNSPGLSTYAGVGVEVDGAYNSVVAPGGDGFFTKMVSLGSPGVSKTVAIIQGLQSKPASTVLGTFCTKISANAAMTPVAQTTPTNRIVIGVDSIGVGGNATTVTQNAWTMKARAAYTGGSIVVDGWGSKTMWDDASDSTKRAAAVARIAPLFTGVTGIKRYVEARQTNDFGLNKWSAAAYGSGLGSFLDDLKTAVPALDVVLVTATTRNNEGVANGSGSTLPDYRTQSGTVQSARSAYCTTVSGPGLVTYPTNFDADLLHPNTTGQNEYFTNVRTGIGV